jgi:hypothetical protein
MWRVLFLCSLVAMVMEPALAQRVRDDLYRHYFGHVVRLTTDIPHADRAAVLESGRWSVAPIDSVSRNRGAFGAAGKRYVVGAIDIRPAEVEFTIYSLLRLPTPVFNPGREVDGDAKIRSQGRTLASPAASIILKYNSPAELAIDRVDAVMRALLKIDERPHFYPRFRRP